MNNVKNLEHYKKEQQNQFSIEKFPEIRDYVNNLYKKLNDYIAVICEDNFWTIFPKIMGVDSKLVLVKELMSVLEDTESGVTEKEIITWVEKDFKCYNRELCGFKLNQNINNSLIFNVE